MHATALSLPNSLRALDGQRIAGTSLAIALHVAVFMVLLMPVQQAPAVDTEVAVPVFFEPIKPIDPPKPPPKDETKKPVISKTPVVLPQRSDPPPDFINDQTVGPIDTVLPPPTIDPPRDFGDEPSFVELATDVAPAPNYPGTALRLNQEGRVLLRVLVDETGRPTEVTIEQSSGFKLLDLAASKIVASRWHFVPAQRNGVAVAAYALVPVEFRIAR